MSRVSTSAEERWVPLLPTDSATFAIHLALHGDPGLVDPFVRLDGGHGTTRAYLGSLRSSGGIEVARVVVQLPPPWSPVNPGYGDAVEAAWRRRGEDQRRLSAVAPDLFVEQMLPGDDDTPCRVPPLVYCRTRRRFFPIPDPVTLAPLHACLDDRCLVRHGLPPVAAGGPPVLKPSSTGVEEAEAAAPGEADEASHRFFVATEDVPERLAAAPVQGLKALREAFGVRLAACVEEDATFDVTNFAAVEAQASRSEGSEPAPWFAFTATEVPCLVTRYIPGSFDRMVDGLGGRPAEAPAAGVVGQPPADDSDDGGQPSGYLFATEGSGLDAVEVLTLKLGLFAQVVEAVERYYRTIGPHLDLRPAHLAVEMPQPSSADLPWRWHFRLRLLGSSSARRLELPQGVHHVAPPERPKRPYASRALREAALIEECQGEVTLESLTAATKGDTGRWILRGRLGDPNGILPLPKADDLVVLRWPRSLLGEDEARTTAFIEPSTPDQGVTDLTFFTRPVALRPEQVQRLETAVGTSIPGIRYRLHPQLHVIDDLHALGVLLLRVLLVNDRQTLGAIEPIVLQIPDAAVSTDAGDEGFTFDERLEANLVNALQEYQDCLAPANVFYRQVDRQLDRPIAIPAESWHEALRLAWRLVARGVGFGLATGAAYDRDHPASHLQRVAEETHALRRRLQTLLFRRQGVHVEVHSVIAELMANV